METSSKRKIGSFVLKRVSDDEEYIGNSNPLPAKKKIVKTKSLKERVENMRVDEFFHLLPTDTQLKLVQGKFNPAKHWISFTWGCNTFEENLLVFEVNIQVDGVRVTCRFTAKMWKHTSESIKDRYLIRVCETDENFVVEDKKEKYGVQWSKSVRVQNIRFVSEDVVRLPTAPSEKASTKPATPPVEQEKVSTDLSLRRELIESFLKDEDTLREEMTKVVKERYTMKIDEMIETKIRKEVEDKAKKEAVERWTTDESLINQAKEEAKAELKKEEEFKKEVSDSAFSELKKSFLTSKNYTINRERARAHVLHLDAEEYKKTDEYRQRIRAEIKEEIRKEMAIEEKTRLLEQKMESIQRSIQKDPRRAEKTIMGPVIQPELDLLADVMGVEGF